MYREKAQGARFFGTEVAASLADAVAQAARRTLVQIRGVVVAARGSTDERQRAFAKTFCDLIREAATMSGQRIAA